MFIHHVILPYFSSSLMFQRFVLSSPIFRIKPYYFINSIRTRRRIFSNFTKCLVISVSLYSIRNKYNFSPISIAKCETAKTLNDNKALPYTLLESISDIFHTLYRIVIISFLFTPPILLLPLKYFSKSEDVWWELVLLCFQLAGPTFVKFGQWMSTRRDVFSSKFCETLSILHSSAWTHSWEATELALVAMLGEDWESQLVNISHDPIGSGCVAQVHKGYFYLDSEQKVLPVAIKVLHPDIRNDINTDLKVIARLAWLIEFIPIFRWLSPCDSIKEFQNVLLDQIDLTLEARNLDTFNRNFRNVKNVTFPKPIWPYVCDDVLIETFHEGKSVAHYLKQTDNHLRTKVAQIGVNSLLKMLFTDNFVHVDLHPGNILVSEKSNDVCVTILDAGLAKELASEDFDNLVGLFRLVVSGNGSGVASILLERSKVQDCKDMDKFREEMDQFVSQVHANKFSLRQFQVSYILRQLFSMAIRHKVKIESNFATIMLAIMIAEGLGRALDPDVDILNSAVPYLLTELVS
ncbi:AarF domain containing kinase 2-like [Oopsacas minuta]|uniref:AarF domain containing kinase 2-like n=1 Tax=Oopsacas minuta TaxID=111878 RepID=A0AAV7KGH7_9METZ|nr:AarF domain containing kinase 2-like [Oopsacas minuta]